MYYGYYICPKCKDRFKQFKQSNGDFERYLGKCNKCGNKLRIAFIGEKEIDDTKYIISLIYQDILNNKNVEGVMKVGGYSIDVAIEKLNTDNSIIYEGDLLHTYLNIEILDDFEVEYNLTPEFPFERSLYVDCPICGGDTIIKTEEAKDTNEYMIHGLFCEKFNQWATYCNISKKKLDNVTYKLSFLIENFDNKIIDDVKNIVYKLPDFKNTDNMFIIFDRAENIHEILIRLKAIDIKYEIEPPYIHEVGKYKEIDEDYLNKILKKCQ